MKTLIRGTSLLLVVALLVGLTVVPGVTQDDSSDKQAVELLKNAAKNTQNASSYTTVMDQNMKQQQSMSNMTINQESTGTVKFEDPYMHINIKTEVSGGPGKAKGQEQVQQLIGKQNDKKELIALFQKDQGSDNWTEVQDNQSMMFKKMFNRFRDPDQVTEQLKNIQFDGEETVNGHECRKINAEQKGSAIEKAAKEMMKGASGNKAQKIMDRMDLSVDVKESDMNVWIRKDSSRIEKVTADTKQTITMSIDVQGNTRSFDMEQDLEVESTFSDYDSTSIPQKLKDKIESLTSNN